ncbi:MAG: TFIIB-type zinc ribbon-containing protein [Clostridiales bacterium]|nr:TFIIB-type zinc ribbon-containing protein [Clostridiales bacterium]
MAGVTYQCPNCGSYLRFRPELQRWKCDSCDSEFNEETLLEKAAEYEHDHDHAHEHAQEEAAAQVVYHCPSCGSAVITDETTVATHCYYCHNPVVLEGKLTRDMRPEKALPFAISKEMAVERFMQWVGKKRFVPKGFFAREQVKNIQGVYYPHFVTDCEVDGSYEGEGRNTSIAQTPQYTITTTQHFRFRRRADINFKRLMRPALKSADRKLSDGIHPFPLETMKPFSGAYLAGFLAERRDIGKDEATADIREELEGYVRPLLSPTLNYMSHSGTTEAKIKQKHSQYVLLPTWVISYHREGDKAPYYFAMNGCTGTVCGKLPVSKGKLLLTGGLLSAACFVVYGLAAYFLF